MASCTQIENMLQAYIDGELGQSDRVILEQHVADCRSCAAAVRKHRRTCALVCEVLAPDRLQRNLAGPILDHLPMMERDLEDVRAINWRAKHPSSGWQRALRFTPVTVGVVLLVLAATLMSRWPSPQPAGADLIGLVTQCSNGARCIDPDSVVRQHVAVKDYVCRGQRYETGSGDSMMVALAGPTELKLNENTRVCLHGDRKISVEMGQIWIDVGRDGRLFRVNTPAGGIVVFGTSFEVSVVDEKTTVTVEKGLVQVENELVFHEVEPGQQVELLSGDPTLVPRQVDVAAEMKWAKDIHADVQASDLFEKEIQAKAVVTLPAEQCFVVMTKKRDVKSIRLEWETEGNSSGCCAYDVYVSDDSMRPLFKERIGNNVFAGKSSAAYEILAPNDVLSDVNVLHIRVVPDLSVGEVETTFTNIAAVI